MTAAARAELPLCLVHVGELLLLFDPAEVRSIEGRHIPGRLLADQVAPLEVDLRDGLQVNTRSDRPESLIVSSPRGPLRLVVCEVEQLLQSELRAVHPLPTILRHHGRQIGLRGVVTVRGELAYLSAPVELGLALISLQGAA
ncbi:MAG: hypothetical protein JKY65_28310 [Planctomycetes bacterium]|nr:hypothetical protein [Planctomycetota bacterium]